MCLFGSSCTANDASLAPESDAPQVVPVANPAPVSAVPVVVGNVDAVQLEMQFQGVSNLFRGFFLDQEVVSALAVELGACFSEQTVVLVAFDQEKHLGTITVQAEPHMLQCMAKRSGTGVDLSNLRPIGRALGNYRDGVSGKYDLRLASFHTGITLIKGMNHCQFWLGGQYPPDGSAWSRCPSISGNKTCTTGDKNVGVQVIQFEDEASNNTLAACLGL